LEVKEPLLPDRLPILIKRTEVILALFLLFSLMKSGKELKPVEGNGGSVQENLVKLAKNLSKDCKVCMVGEEDKTFG